jgi:uncharacterized protein YdaT
MSRLFTRIYEGYPENLLVPVTKQAAYDMAREADYGHIDTFDTNTEEEEPIAEEEPVIAIATGHPYP